MKIIFNNINRDESDDLIMGYEHNPWDFIEFFITLNDCVAKKNDAQCFIDRETIGNFIDSASAVLENNDRYPFHYFKARIESVLAKYNPSEYFNRYNDNDATYLHCTWGQANYETNPINGTLLSNISEFILTYEDDILIFSLTDINQVPEKRFTILKDNQNTGYKAEIVNINYTTSLDEIKKWLDDNSRKKKFKANPKHGMAGNDFKKGEAILYCKNSEEAQGFLDIAIKAEKGKDLYAYDKGRQKWIVFKNDNFKIFLDGEFIERYHAYHVEKADENVQVPREIAAGLK